jgi:hypothetical protein
MPQQAIEHRFMGLEFEFPLLVGKDRHGPKYTHTHPLFRSRSFRSSGLRLPA